MEHGQLYATLDDFKNLTATQPHALIEALEEVGARLDAEDPPGPPMRTDLCGGWLLGTAISIGE
jgi:hypothetical protein